MSDMLQQGALVMFSGRSLSLVLLAASSLAVSGCGPDHGRTADAEVEAKRMVGTWKARIVSDPLGKTTESSVYYVFTKPGRDGKGRRFSFIESGAKLAPLGGALEYHALTTYDDGMLVEMDLMSLAGAVRNTIEIVDTQDASAVLGIDNAMAKQMTEKLSGDGSSEPDEYRYVLNRVIDAKELARVSAAVALVKKR